MGTFVDYPSIHPSTHTIKVNDHFFWQIPIDKIKAQFRSLEIRNEKKNQLEPIRSASTSLWGIKVNGHFFWVDTQDKLKPQFSFTREIIIEIKINCTLSVLMHIPSKDKSFARLQKHRFQVWILKASKQFLEHNSNKMEDCQLISYRFCSRGLHSGDKIFQRIKRSRIRKTIINVIKNIKKKSGTLRALSITQHPQNKIICLRGGKLYWHNRFATVRVNLLVDSKWTVW